MTSFFLLPFTAALHAALVGALAGVDATMAGQGAAVAEAFLTLGVFADVGALTRVGALVDSQGRPLDKRLCASELCADKGSIETSREVRGVLVTSDDKAI